MTTNQTVIQLLAPDHLRGRVTSILQLSIVLNPIGVLSAGVLADYLGPTGAGIVLSLAGFALTTGILVFSSRMRMLRLSALRELGKEGVQHGAGARSTRAPTDRAT
jgi:hypothetical protein